MELPEGTVLRKRTLTIPGKNRKTEIEALFEELGQPPLKLVPIDFEDLKEDNLGTNFMYFQMTNKATGKVFNTLDEGITLDYAPEDITDIFGVRTFTNDELKKSDLLILREYTLHKQPVPTNVDIVVQR